MRTLLVTNDFLPQVGGIQQYSDNIARRLPGATVLAPTVEGAAATDTTLPYPVRRFAGRYMVPGKRLAAAIRSEQPDVVLFMTPWPLPPVAGRLDIPWAVCTHGAELVIPARIPGLRSALAATLRRSGCIYAVSAYTGGHARRLAGPATPVRYLRTGVPLETFHPGVDGAPVRRRYRFGDAPLIVHVGRLVPRKGQDTLIRALPAIRRRAPGARLLLVGQGPYRAALERQAAATAPGAVSFTGRIPWDELPAHYAAGDVFASPVRSRWAGLEQEGFGVIFLEAQAVGRPAVSGRSGGAPEAVVEGETGHVVDGTDPAAVAAAVGPLLADPERASRMGQAGRRFVEDNFRWEDIVDRLASDLAALAAGRPLGSEL